MQYVTFLEHITAQDVPLFGGKNASLGQMIRDLSERSIRVPSGFATSADAYRRHVEVNGLFPQMEAVMAELGAGEITDLKTLADVGLRLRLLIAGKPLPDDVREEIINAYRELSQRYGTDACDVAVRSSATAEDLPHASFAGQHETFLRIEGEEQVVQACLFCMASLFTDRAISYRRQHGFGDFEVAMSVGVQKMVRSDQAVAGVMFTLDPESGFPDAITINASYGLGETVVKGVVNVDEYVVHKPMLKKGLPAIVRRTLGSKQQRLVYRKTRGLFTNFFGTAGRRGTGAAAVNELFNPSGESLELQSTGEDEQRIFCLTDAEVLELARYGEIIEELYTSLRGVWSPMDIEWAQDGPDGPFYIVQARPETVHSSGVKKQSFVTYQFSKQPVDAPVLATGLSIGYGIVAGTARVVEDLSGYKTFADGDILVADMTDPDWIPLLRKAGAVVTNRGGRTCHAAIISREFGIPAVIGAINATQVIPDGAEVTVDCSAGTIGTVFDGHVPFTRLETPVMDLGKPPVPLFVNLGDPSKAFYVAQLPVAGVGLARLEFIISSLIGVHPMACAAGASLEDVELQQEIAMHLGCEPEEWADRYVDMLVDAIVPMAAAFYPRPVIIRSTDFKSNEYRQLVGGALFEPQEENPTIGFRGAARYCDDSYAPAFALECRAFKKVREERGFENVKILVPFVRAPSEAKKVIELFGAHGLVRGEKGLEILMMIEIPSNTLQLRDFGPYFDGFSIGSNDLTQLILGVDRDSALVQHLYDERNDVMLGVLKNVLATAREMNKPIGICGQAPSDHPELVKILVAAGITSISLSPDAVIPFLVKQKS